MAVKKPTPIAEFSIVPQKRIRLLKVMVQPVILVDDGESLIEYPTQAVAVLANQFGNFHSALERELERIQSEINAPQDAPSEE